MSPKHITVANNHQAFLYKEKRACKALWGFYDRFKMCCRDCPGVESLVAAVLFEFCAKRVDGERLDHVVRDTSLSGLHYPTFLRFGGDHDDWDVLVLPANLRDYF